MMPISTSDSPSVSPPSGSLPGSSPLVPMASRNRRGSIASGDSPFRARRTSMSTNQPPSPSLNLAAAASLNASMRAGSPGPATTARDSVDTRRKSVVADLIMADDSLPPPAEIATGDRKPSMSDGLYRIPSLSLKESSSVSPAVSPNPFVDRSRGNLNGSPRMAGVEPTRTSMNTADPFHKRTPSVGEVHQQMEQEQEAQVNRLLLQIHQQQMQIETLKRQNDTPTMSGAPSTAGSDTISQPTLTPITTPANAVRPPPTPDRAHSSGSATTTTASTMPAARISPTVAPVSRPARSGSPMSLSLQRRSSSRSSRPTSPSVKSAAQRGYLETDETQYWQAEASNLERENAILKSRIRELEKQVRAGHDSGANDSTVPHRSSSLATESMNIES